MSGGHFGYCGYDYIRVRRFSDELEEEIANNDKGAIQKGTYSEEFYPNYKPEVISYLKAQIPKMRKLAEIMKHIDYLYSGDHGEDSFFVASERS